MLFFFLYGIWKPYKCVGNEIEIYSKQVLTDTIAAQHVCTETIAETASDTDKLQNDSTPARWAIAPHT